MSDTVKYSTVFNIECLFVDGDTRTITLKDPNNAISSTQVENLESFLKETNIIIGDRTGSDFRKIKKALKRQTVTTYLDLS